MSTSRRSLPPLNALRTFEAAARQCSFKQAAEELCVTQAAVSRQIQVLEDFYGLELFSRGHRQVQLTAAGQTLYQTASAALSLIANTSHDLRHPNAGAIELITTGAFAQLWLTPRLKHLQARHPNLQLHLLGREDAPDCRQNFQAAVTLGLEEHPRYAADLLFSEEIFPVCTPAFLALHPLAATLTGLLAVPLLDLSASHWKARLWRPIDWSFWLDQFQLDATRCRRLMNFSHYTLLMDAVRDDLGVGLAWRHLVQGQLDQGTLVRPLGESYRADDRRHYFVYRRDLASQGPLRNLRDWLLEQTATSATEYRL